MIFSVDRLDYTKGILNRLRGYELFLKNNPQWHGRVVFVLSVAPSRTGVGSYQRMRQEIDQTVGRIGGAFGRVNWTPLIYQYRTLSFDEIVAMYRLRHVAMITPLRDGMNLVAKEFIASRIDGTGVLVLSEMAGAAKEMGEAIIISPFHHAEIARAVEQALDLSVEEQIRRNHLLQLYVDRLPGALLEEKEFSLAWHYRRADPEQAFVRAKELLDDLADYTRNIDVQVFEEDKVIEVRNTGVSKGTAAMEWLTNRSADFILAIGDD